MRCFAFLLTLLLAFPAQAQNILFPANPGDMIVRGTGTTWGPVAGGLAGRVLQSNGPTAAPVWSNSLPLNFQLPPMAVNTVWCNVSGAQAPATACSISQILNTIDYDVQRPPLAGSVPYVGTDQLWHLAPPPSTAGWVWTAQGTGVVPQWAVPSIVASGSGITGPCESGGLLFNYNGTLHCTDSTSGAANVSSSGTLHLPILVNDTRFGLHITHTLGVGPIPGALYSNLIKGSLDATITGSGGGGTDVSANWALVQISASVGSNYDAIGGTDVGQAFGLAVGMVGNGPTTTTSDIVGLSAGTASNYTNPNSRFYASVFSATMGEHGTTPFLIDAEFGGGIFNPTPGAVALRSGANFSNYGTFRATEDQVISVVGGNLGGEWGNFVNFIKPPGVTTDPLATTANVINASLAQTVNSIINTPLWDISGYVYNTKHAIVTGSGIGVFGSLTSDGALAIKGGAGANLSLLLQTGASPTWSLGGTAAVFYLSAVGVATPAINISVVDNLVTMAAGFKAGTVAVAALPTCNAGLKATQYFVTDSNAASYTAGIGAIVADGGTTQVPVICDGTNWRIG
jgi:hypothetical protein